MHYFKWSSIVFAPADARLFCRLQPLRSQSSIGFNRIFIFLPETLSPLVVFRLYVSHSFSLSPPLAFSLLVSPICSRSLNPSRFSDVCVEFFFLFTVSVCVCVCVSPWILVLSVAALLMTAIRALKPFDESIGIHSQDPLAHSGANTHSLTQIHTCTHTHTHAGTEECRVMSLEAE